MRLSPLLLLALAAHVSHAQAPASPRSAGATVSGIVRDSVAHASLCGAMVQLVAADGQARAARSATADSLGQYRIDSVPDGRYMLGFFHPMLDSLGLEPTVRELTVAGGTSLRVNLATPAPAQIRAAICGPASATDSSAVLVGTVRDARDGTAMAGATVSGEWMEYTFSTTGMQRRMPRLVATTSENGWFAICNVPRIGTIALLATRGADSTDLLDVQMPVEGFLRHELYLGPAVTTVVRPAAARADAPAPPPRRTRRGTGQVSGSVVAAVGNKPIPGATVGLLDGPQIRVGDDGEFTLADAPSGTRVLEVRAVGYYPARRRVDVVPGAPPVRVALSTLRAMLDTVRVTAARVRGIDYEGFVERRKNAGAGRYLTPEDIARRNPLNTSDIFRSVSGLSLDLGSDGFRHFITMRGAFTDRCAPAIYFNGSYVGGLASDGGGLDADDLNAFVKPREIAGIEVYPQGTAPPQFQQGMSDCGSIVIWSK
jgi:hypothetical protein